MRLATRLFAAAFLFDVGTADIFADVFFGVAFGFFDFAFDPLTGMLWDTENGPEDYDEINVVKPGFNSGWEQVMGPIDRSGRRVSELVQLGGFHYEDPMFSWRQAQGMTDIEFLNSTRIGDKYAYNIFVGDIVNGNLYYFTVNKDRTGLELSSPGLDDLVTERQ